jgi:transcription factor C subunit 7
MLISTKFRSNWVVDPKTGTYSTTIPSPTGIASDPALAGYGVQQSKELTKHLVMLSPPIQRIYSSPFYRWYVLLKTNNSNLFSWCIIS